ncbi:hypothetical protein [Cylindrospermum sp. FACHB-282]|uniref:hypothetical protein n=1 Tax=Cylindrospermum sp. FACHB-282 TaxID=2692794 RepID=UPI001689F0E4|nr:hypothetical protein [Cylindrospermum sp. FACHB-282]MBD2388873.1 hypothetical protein [Cylindrospermum sp. FACHB-282]
MTKHSNEQILAFAKSEIEFYLSHESAHPDYEYDDEGEIILDDIGCVGFRSCKDFKIKDATIDLEDGSTFENCIASVIVKVDWTWSSEGEDEDEDEEDVELLIELCDVGGQLSANRTQIERIN